MSKTGRSANYRPIEILEIEITARMLENEALGRYVTSPKNLAGIRVAFRKAFKELSGLTVEPPSKCPDGWYHTPACYCTIDPTGGHGSLDPALHARRRRTSRRRSRSKR